MKVFLILGPKVWVHGFLLLKGCATTEAKPELSLKTAKRAYFASTHIIQTVENLSQSAMNGKFYWTFHPT